MFEALPASGANLVARPKWVTTSLVVHVLVATLAVLATRGALRTTKTAALEETTVRFFPHPMQTERTGPIPRIPMAKPAPELFEQIPVPDDVAPTIPPIDFGQRPFDPHDFAGLGSDTETPKSTDNAGAAGGPDTIYGPASQVEGFEPAVLLSQPQPEYPGVLLSTGMSGTVLLEFVIGTAGKVDPTSVRIVESSHPAFERAAREAVVGARFQPALLRGHPVRQITRQRVRFVAK